MSASVQIEGNFGKNDYLKIPQNFVNQLDDPAKKIIRTSITDNINTQTGATESDLKSESTYDELRGYNLFFISNVPWAHRLEYKSRSYMRAGIRGARRLLRKLMSGVFKRSIRFSLRNK